MSLITETGKSYFYQWDTNQILIVEDEPNCQEVHFSHRGDPAALVCSIYEADGERVVDVPNILLQQDKPITAYLFSRADDSNQTCHAWSFLVIGRPQPEDYVYTETEVLTYKALEERIIALEEGGGTVTNEQIATAVESYLEENPVEVPNVDLTGVVKSINGTTPDETGNVEITIPDSGGNANQGTGWTAEQISLLDELFNHIHFNSAEGGKIADSLIASLRGGESGEEEPDEPVTPEKTLSSISATYSGGDVAVGTAVTDMTGIVVTATYSDGSTATVTDYTLSGEIVEGSNTITVSYGGKTTTFTVTGVAESGGEDAKTINMTLRNSGPSLSNSTFYEGDADSTALTMGAGWWYKSDAIADEDTVVTISFAPGGVNAGIVYYAAQIKQENHWHMYYVEQLGAATTTNEQSKEYTVRAGYELVVLVSNNSELATLNVTYTDGSFTNVTEFYTNLVEGFTLDAYLKSNDGTITNPWSQQNVSDLIDVFEVNSVYIWHKTNATIEQYALTCCFYDSSEVFISGGKAPANTDAITPVAAPAGAKYIRVGGSRSDTKFGVYVGVNPAPYYNEFVEFE